MIQYKQSKKIKGSRKKLREEVYERLLLQYPIWFEDKTDKEINELVTAFRLSGKTDDEFPSFCIEHESKIESLLENK